MAGDWVKMRSNLDTHPKVVAIACDLETSELHVVGMLWKVWTWADQHSLDGNAICVTESFLNRITGNANFSAALRNVGWLDGNDGELTFPRFSEHNGKTAKSRSETALRVNKHRSEVKQKCNAPTVTNALPEKRREEKNDITHTTQGDALTFLTGPTAAQKAFRDAYPNKIKPKQVYAEFAVTVAELVAQRQMTDQDAEEFLIEKAKAYAASPAGMPPPPGQDEDFRPSGAEWLKAGRYDEPYSVWMKPNIKGNRNGNGSGGYSRGGKKPPSECVGVGEPIDIEAIINSVPITRSSEKST